MPEFFSAAYSEAENLSRQASSYVKLDESLNAKVYTGEKMLSVPEFLKNLSQVQTNRTYDYQPSTAALHTVLQLSVQLVANGAIVPQIVQMPDKQFTVRWLPAMLSNDVKSLVTELESILPPDIFTGIERNREKPVNRERALNLLSLFISEIVRLVSYDAYSDLFEKLFFKSYSHPFSAPGEESLAGGIMAWLQKFYLTQDEYKPYLIVDELMDESFRIDISVVHNSSQNDDPVGLHDILNNKVFDTRRFEILQSLTHLSSFINGLDDYINSGGEKEIIMGIRDFTPFLMHVIPAIQLLDISVLLPKSLREILKPKTSVRLKSKTSGSSFLRLDKLLDFEWQVAVGDTLMGEEEFRKLLLKSEGLIRFKSQYIYVEKEDLEKIYKHFSQSKDLPGHELLRAALSGEFQGSKIEMTEEVKSLVRELTEFIEIQLPNGLQAELRPYQKRGFSWIYRNTRIGFGSVLADDMGLGKTLQVIAAILKFKEEGHMIHEKVLVVAPTGLLTNWQAEFQKFAPSVIIAVYHGVNRDLKQLKGYEVLITSYGIARSDASILKKVKWYALVIDEAQNIKNEATGQTKAIKSIPAANFIAMSGTPVENRLSELWSIMDYSNRGFLGTVKSFKETYANPIEQLNDANTAEN